MRYRSVNSQTCSRETGSAFALFTKGYNSWWPGHHIGTAEMAEAVLKPRAGGRYYERGVDGSECEWSRVLACDPPRRIVVAWQITVNGDAWVYDPDPSHASEFEVTFREQPGGQTRVELEHRNIDRHGPGAAGIHQGIVGPGRLARHPGQLRQDRNRGLTPPEPKRPHRDHRVRALAHLQSRALADHPAAKPSPAAMQITPIC